MQAEAEPRRAVGLSLPGFGRSGKRRGHDAYDGGPQHRVVPLLVESIAHLLVAAQLTVERRGRDLLGTSAVPFAALGSGRVERDHDNIHPAGTGQVTPALPPASSSSPSVSMTVVSRRPRRSRTTSSSSENASVLAAMSSSPAPTSARIRSLDTTASPGSASMPTSTCPRRRARRARLPQATAVPARPPRQPSLHPRSAHARGSPRQPMRATLQLTPGWVEMPAPAHVQELAASIQREAAEVPDVDD